MTDALRGAIVAAANATFLCFQAFGVPLSNVQQAAAGAVVNGWLIVWMVARHKRP